MNAYQFYSTEPRHAVKTQFLDFAFTKVLFKIFGALSKDTYRDICNYCGIWPIEVQISARQGNLPRGTVGRKVTSAERLLI